MFTNKLALNTKKPKIMLITNNKVTKKDFSIQIQHKIIRHSDKVKILGTVLSGDMSWDNNITN